MKLLQRLFLPGLALALFMASPALADDENWRISQFDSQITLEPNGVVAISETIAADFGQTTHHGIFRYIPSIYNADSGKIATPIKINSVEQNGTAARYSTPDSDNSVVIKIGDPKRTISGKQTYKISYTVQGIIKSYHGYDELYWNVAGSGWQQPIDSISATVNLPSDGITQTSCYQGPTGSQEACTTAASGKQSVTFTASRPLNINEDLTVAVGFTTGLVPIIPPKPYLTTEQRAAQTLTSPTTWTVAGTVALIGLLILGRLVWRRGRDERYKKSVLGDQAEKSIELVPLGSHETIVAEYEPPVKMRPAELKLILTEQVDRPAIAATIIDLASRGYLTITELPKHLLQNQDYQFDQKKKPDDKLRQYEAELLKLFFEGRQTVKISDLKNSGPTIDSIKKLIENQAVTDKLFATNPRTVRVWTSALGAILAFGSSYALISPISYIDGPLAFWVVGSLLGLAFLGVTTLAIVSLMPKRTAHGREIYRQALGYALFIRTVERYRARFAEKQNDFNSILPYAIALGLTDKFIKAMKKMDLIPPSPVWYIGPHPIAWGSFDDQVGRFDRAFQTATAPSSSGSGGGGSSGGGFGGGGGGSW